MTRHHRERIIKKQKKLLDSIWFNGWASNDKPDGYLAKHSSHHHSCDMCNMCNPRYKYERARLKREERTYIEEKQ